MPYDFFQNKECEYFPCHPVKDINKFSCLFCFCPLYPRDDCGGNYTYTKLGAKDCSACLIPHYSYSYVIDKLKPTTNQSNGGTDV